MPRVQHFKASIGRRYRQPNPDIGRQRGRNCPSRIQALRIRGYRDSRKPYWIARAAGRGLSETYDLSPAEYFGWQKHVNQFPPLEKVVPLLLATLCSLTYNANYKAEDGKDRTPEDFAPWLITEEERKKRKDEAEEEALVAHTQAVTEAYNKKKEENA